jgi:AcrR family transcriptional regulator
MSSVSLREQHAMATRERILSAVAELLEQGEADDLTMPGVAAASGVSLRTVYRYYPTREELLEAVGRWIGDELLRLPIPRDLDEVADQFQAACRQFDDRPGLVRAMALSQVGQRVRGYRRHERLDAIGQALQAEVGGLSARDRRAAEAVLGYLHNMLAYTTIREETGLSGAEIGDATAWAIRTLVEDLRQRDGQSKGPG